MDVICQELGIPRKQIKETKRLDRFIAVVHKSWLKCLVQENSLSKFPIHPGFDEWPTNEGSIGSDWSLTYITIYKKFTHKVIPLPNCRKESADTEFILNFTQLLQNISASNHRNLWKDAFNKYAGQRAKVPVKETINRNERNTVNLVPYDTVLLEAIVRTYGCNLLHAKLDKVNHIDDMRADKRRLNANEVYGRFEPHANLFPISAVIETSSHFVVIYGNFLENTLNDCITYSPAIMEESYNKPLFIIYQLLQLMKSLHDRGLLLGNIGLDDIFITDNLWLQVMPQIDLNILQSTAEDVTETLNENVAQRKPPNYSVNVPLVDDLSYSLKDYCEMWCNGQISNFNYLTLLNSMSGRRLGDPSFHHIMPWVTDFVSRNGMNWRDLTKSKYRLNKGDIQLDLMFAPSGAANMIPHHVSDALSEITYMVYMARRTPKSVLCKHVRPIWVPHEYPASIQRLYDWTPDECIPEFFSDPLVFKSIHEDMPDLEIPAWSSCPEDFIARHREALESQTVSERLHHWIDLNFGYKLSGIAAIKSKNVHLSIVDHHQTLCKRGIVQLFNHPHPPKQYQTIWTSKTPPRIYSQNEIRHRMTRSTEDLSNKYRTENDMNDSVGGNNTQDSISRALRSTSKNRTQPPNIPEDVIYNASIERSTSLHSNVQKSQNQIILPKDYNPIAALNAVENMEIFLSKTFYKCLKNENAPKSNNKLNATTATVASTSNDEGINAFTNQIFSDRFAENLMKDTKRLHNLNHKNLFVQSSTRNYKQIISNHRHRELQVIACIIVEIFLAPKLRPLSMESMQKLTDRVEACKNVLKADFDLLPKCVQYPIKLLFSFGDGSEQTITDIGLPKASANQMLQPFLSNFLFPFPHEYLNTYTLLRTLYQYETTNQMLDFLSYFGSDRIDDALFKQRTLYKRKIAECKVMACAAQTEKLLVPRGYEQYNVVELILPHIIGLLTSESTSILAAWFLFDGAAVALGQSMTQKYLLEPILRLYDAESDERVTFLNSNFDSSMKFTNGISFKSRKTIKLYHHSFLLRLIVRFGLSCFLNNFVPPLIEAIGGCKEATQQQYYHCHNSGLVDSSTKQSNKSYQMCSIPSMDEIASKKASESEEMFTFENEADDIETQRHLTDSSDTDVDTISQHMLDLRLNHSNAMEVTEETTLSESGLRLSDLSGLSFEEEQNDGQSHDITTEQLTNEGSNLISPTIPIPSSSKRNQLSTIDCEIGSKISSEDADLLESSMSPRTNKDKSTTVSMSSMIKPSNFSDQQTQYQISDMSAESLIWLSHRLGPVLTARHLTRNLLKMLTLCYIGQENLLPDLVNDESVKNLHDNLLVFTIADGRVSGDRSAVKVLECLTSITSIYGDHFILLQYFPHITELIALCKKRFTPSLEGGLISSLQLLKYLVPCLSDTVIMDQLHDTILKSIIHPIIRFIASTRFLMPNGFLARSVLARKLLDAMYVLAVRIGPEMTKNHLCVPALQRFFLIFDKAHGISDHFGNDPNEESRNSPTFEDANFIEIRRDGGTKEWSIKGSPIQITTARSKGDNLVDSITPPKQQCEDIPEPAGLSSREKALEEIKEVFTPQLAHVSYVPFLKYLGDYIMKQFVKNLSLILTLCHEFEQPEYASLGCNHRKDSSDKTHNEDSSIADGVGIPSNSFGTAMIGNRIEVYKNEHEILGPMELLDLISHKYDQINSTRHLRGNWLAYWEHEIGRPEKNNHFNFKQIKLQTFAGHANSVRSLLCLDNENSFMSASKDKTVKLWSLRSEGDGSKISSCQFTYTNHRKSVHSLAFLESLRLAVSCDSGVHIWDPFVGGSIGQLESHKLTPISIVKTYSSPSSLILAGTAESTIKTIDARTFSYVNEWKFTINQMSGSVRCIAMPPSCHWIAVGLSSGQLILCDGRTGMIIACWKATDGELLQLLAINEDQLISTSLDHSICVWSALDGSLLYYIKSPNEPVHVLRNNQNELIFGTPANRIGVYANTNPETTFSITKLRTETFKGVLTSMAVLPLNRMLLVGGDSGNISLLC